MRPMQHERISFQEREPKEMLSMKQWMEQSQVREEEWKGGVKESSGT